MKKDVTQSIEYMRWLRNDDCISKKYYRDFYDLCLLFYATSYINPYILENA